MSNGSPTIKCGTGNIATCWGLVMCRVYQKGRLLTVVQKHRPPVVEAGSPVVELGVPVLRGNAVDNENLRHACSDLSSI